MKVVSNASPLISLARIGLLAKLQELFEVVYISTDVYNEVVIAGAGMPGSSAVSRAEWIQVLAIHDTRALADAMATTGAADMVARVLMDNVA